MDVFTDLVGSIAAPYIVSNQENKSTSSYEQMSKHDYLNELSVDEIKLIIKKYLSFDYSDNPNQKIMRSFLILLTIPCFVMFTVLITQHISIFLKILISFLTIIHVIIITFFMHQNFTNAYTLPENINLNNTFTSPQQALTN